MHAGAKLCDLVQFTIPNTNTLQKYSWIKQIRLQAARAEFDQLLAQRDQEEETRHLQLQNQLHDMEQERERMRLQMEELQKVALQRTTKDNNNRQQQMDHNYNVCLWAVSRSIKNTNGR